MLTGEVLDIAAPGLLANDYSGIGALEILSFSAVSDGLLNLLANGSLTFTPDSGFVGTTVFTYTLGDALGRTSVATVRIEVEPNGVPVAPTAWLLLGGLAVLRRNSRRRAGTVAR